jgi:nitroimidazol reductase NimA-like FMN-containing flavoprotein (pyridoxamine 5'-phosphate oxidase superfamily)
MQIEEMTVGECRAMLARRHIARLACAHNNQPYVVPIHVAFDGVSLYGYSTLGQKIEWMRQNPLVCVEMDEIVADAQWESVVAFGSYEELLATLEDENSRREAERLFQTRPMWWEPASVPLAGREQRPRIVFRIHLHGLTGRRALRDTVNTAHLLENASDARRAHWLVRALRRLVGRPVAPPPT